MCPVKYRRAVYSKEVKQTLKEICERFEIYLHELGSDEDHVHFLIQSVPIYSPTKIIKTVKSITAQMLFEKHPEVKKKLWGGHFWAS